MKIVIERPSSARRLRWAEHREVIAMSNAVTWENIEQHTTVTPFVDPRERNPKNTHSRNQKTVTHDIKLLQTELA